MSLLAAPLLPADPAAVVTPSSERRSTMRFATALAVTTRTGAVKCSPALLLDLSVAGCRLRTAEWLAPGSFVMVSIGSFRAFDALVAWCGGGVAGLRFAWPLHAAILAHLLALGEDSGRPDAGPGGSVARPPRQPLDSDSVARFGPTALLSD